MDDELNWARIALKNGVQLNPGHLYPSFHRMLDVALQTAPETTDGLVVVTSLNDGRHRRDSKHYDDEAVDLRCWNVFVDIEPPDRDWESRKVSRALADGWASEMQRRLGENYQILFEEDLIWIESLERRVLVPHIHGEWDRREGA